MTQLAAWIDEAVTAAVKEDEAVIGRIAAQVRDLLAGVPDVRPGVLPLVLSATKTGRVRCAAPVHGGGVLVPGPARRSDPAEGEPGGGQPDRDDHEVAERHGQQRHPGRAAGDGRAWPGRGNRGAGARPAGVAALGVRAAFRTAFHAAQSARQIVRSGPKRPVASVQICVLSSQSRAMRTSPRSGR